MSADVPTPLELERRRQCHSGEGDDRAVRTRRQVEAIVELERPEQVRRSRTDPAVYLDHRRHEAPFCCVVVKHRNGDGFVVTTYLTDKVPIESAVVS